MTAPFSITQRRIHVGETSRLLPVATHRSSELLEVARSLRGGDAGSDRPVEEVVAAMALADAEVRGLEERALRPFAVSMGVAAVILLGSNLENWQFNGSDSNLNSFRSRFFTGQSSALQAYARELLGLQHKRAIEEARVFSGGRIECTELGKPPSSDYSDVPRFTIEANSLAQRFRAFVSGPIFFAG